MGSTDVALNRTPMMEFAPDAELGVVFLLGALWEYLPEKFRVTFVKFEATPADFGADKGKFFDALGTTAGSEKRQKVEFKLLSSGLFKDVAKHHGLKADWLICWEDDAEEAVLDYITDREEWRVVALKEVYDTAVTAGRIGKDKLSLLGNLNPRSLADGERARQANAVSLHKLREGEGLGEGLKDFLKKLETDFEFLPGTSEVTVVEKSQTDPKKRRRAKITGLDGMVIEPRLRIDWPAPDGKGWPTLEQVKAKSPGWIPDRWHTTRETVRVNASSISLRLSELVLEEADAIRSLLLREKWPWPA